MLYHKLANYGGYTTTAHGRRPPQFGYIVGDPEWQTVPFWAITNHILFDHASATPQGKYAGAWRKDDLVYLNYCTWWAALSTAVMVAVGNKQNAIYDLHRERVLYIPDLKRAAVYHEGEESVVHVDGTEIKRFSSSVWKDNNRYAHQLVRDIGGNT